MTFAPRLYVKPLNLSHFQISCRSEQTRQGACFFTSLALSCFHSDDIA